MLCVCIESESQEEQNFSKLFPLYDVCVCVCVCVLGVSLKKSKTLVNCSCFTMLCVCVWVLGVSQEEQNFSKLFMFYDVHL